MAFAGSEEAVTSAETALGRRLPSDLRQRLIAENGGEMEAGGDTWRLYPVWDPTDRRTVARTTNHILRENEQLRADSPEALPNGFVAIADNGGGDLLVIGPAGDELMFWDHETREVTDVDVRW